MKKKYLLFIDGLNSGGAERQIGYLATELHNAGHEVKLITFYENVNFFADEIRGKGVTIESHPEGILSFKRPFTIRRIIRIFQPDIVIAYKEGATIPCCLAKFICKFKLFVSERNTTQNLTLREHIKFWLYKKADKIIPNSYSQKDFIEKNFPKLVSKTVVITNMIDLNRFRFEESKEENFPLRVITTARIMPQKNVLNYVRAVAELKKRGYNLKFEWYGQGDINNPTYKDSIDKLIRHLRLNEVISFHQPVVNIEDIYRCYDIFLLPSNYEGFPNVLCEAMVSGLPAVVTAVCDSPIILTDKRFHADPEKPDSIADALERLINLSTCERQNIGKANRERIISLCSPENFLRSYEEL